MAKKNFKDNPALAYIDAQYDAQEVTQDDTQQHAHEDAQEVSQQNAPDRSVLPPLPTSPKNSNKITHIPSTHEDTQQHAQDDTQEDAQEVVRHGYIKTQGRKGHSKPRINLAFDSDAFLNKIRVRADREGMSITQFVNEAVAYYLNHIN